MVGHEREQSPTVSNSRCAERIRYRYLSQLQDSEDPQVGLLHRMATDIAGNCGHTLLKAHPLAWGWTVTEAVDAFHARSFAGGTAGVKELIASDSRHGHALLHLPPDTRDFTGRAELVSEVTHLIAAAAASSGTAFPIVCLSGQAGIGKTTLSIYHDLHDHLEEARAKVRYALVFRDQYLSEQAIPLLEEGLRGVRELGDRRWEARALRQLAIVHRNDGDTPAAIAMLTECLSIFGELGDRRGRASLAERRGADPALLTGEARALCRERGIASEEKITSALREW